MTGSNMTHIRLSIPFKTELWASYDLYLPFDFNWQTLKSEFCPDFDFEAAKEAAIEEALWGDKSLEFDETEAQWEVDEDALQSDINHLKEEQQHQCKLSATVKYKGEKLVFFDDPNAFGIELIEFLALFKKPPLASIAPLSISDAQLITIDEHSVRGVTYHYTITAPKSVWERAEIAFYKES